MINNTPSWLKTFDIHQARVVYLFYLKLSTANCYKIKKERKNVRQIKRARIDHMTERKRRQNVAMCCSVSLQG